MVMVFEYSGGGYAQPLGAALAIPDSENINMPVQGTAFTAKRGVAFHDPPCTGGTLWCDVFRISNPKTYPIARTVPSMPLV